MLKVIYKVPFSKAYTLLELVIIIALVAILAITALPKFLNVANFQGNTFAKTVLASVRYAQKIAVGMGCHIQVATTSNSITLLARANCTTGSFTQSIIDPAFGGTGFTRTAPAGTTISNTNLPIYFNGLGQSLSVATSTVSNATITVNGIIINVIGETGYAY